MPATRGVLALSTSWSLLRERRDQALLIGDLLDVTGQVACVHDEPIDR